MIVSCFLKAASGLHPFSAFLYSPDTGLFSKPLQMAYGNLSNSPVVSRFGLKGFLACINFARLGIQRWQWVVLKPFHQIRQVFNGSAIIKHRLKRQGIAFDLSTLKILYCHAKSGIEMLDHGKLHTIPIWKSRQIGWPVTIFLPSTFSFLLVTINSTLTPFSSTSLRYLDFANSLGRATSPYVIVLSPLISLMILMGR